MGLAANTFRPLPLGEVTPRGWLRKQLEIQAEGITADLDEHWEPLANNQWRGGEHDGWERGPYYADGLLPLGQLLGDEELIAKADDWVESFLSWQQDDGWIGPRSAAFDRYPHDTWPRAVVLKVLQQHYETNNDDRSLDAARQFCRLLFESELDERPLSDWGKFRWQELALGVHWLYEETGEEWLCDLGHDLAEQGYDWISHFTGGRRLYDFEYDRPAPEWTHETHVVNTAMGIKTPAIHYRQSQSTTAETVQDALLILDAYHGQATGVFTGDENLAGRDPTRGTELCAVVEFMYSLEKLIATFGQVALADRLERVAYNALPATFTSDMQHHQYDQQANQVMCSIGDYPWTNGPDANLFGIEPNYGCCTANLHQGWPKFVKHLWMASDSGLVAPCYGPSEVTTTIDGVDVTVIEDTEYPFADTVELIVESSDAVTFSLGLRIPGWSTAGTITLPDGSKVREQGGQFVTIDRKWTNEERVELTFDIPVTCRRGYQGSVSLTRGPLVFSLPIESEFQQLGDVRSESMAQHEVFPVSAWNYGLSIDHENPDADVSIRRSGIGSVPFDESEPPIELAVSGATVDDWTLADTTAGPIPQSPRRVDETTELTLSPYGATTLRITEFPLVYTTERP